MLARGARLLGTGLWRVGDQTLIDGALVNGSARDGRRAAGRDAAARSPAISTHYAFAMIIGLAALVGWFVFAGL